MDFRADSSPLPPPCTDLMPGRVVCTKLLPIPHLAAPSQEERGEGVDEEGEPGKGDASALSAIPDMA